MKYLLPSLLILLSLLVACNEDDDEDIGTPDLSILTGFYSGSIQHDIISSPNGFELIDTSIIQEDFITTVQLQGESVSLSFANGGDYELPDLTYDIRKIEKWEFFEVYDVFLTLRTTSDYRMKAEPNQVVDPVFRILDDHPNNLYKVELRLFLRSQDPDSVYNIFVDGYK